MENQLLIIEKLNNERFSTFGDVLEVQETPTVTINQGNCQRYSDLAQMDFADGRAGISIFEAKPYSSPLNLAMMERHPEGSQAFIPLSNSPFLVVVAEDDSGRPKTPSAFITDGTQGVNYHRNVWHAVLTPIQGNGLFAVVDRIGSGKNLEEHWFDTPYVIEF